MTGEFCFACAPEGALPKRAKCVARGTHRPTGEVLKHAHSTTGVTTRVQRCADCGTLVVKV